MRIAVFDSGIGGITVLSEAVNRLPYENFIYFADTLHVPYGTKPKEEVRGYIIAAMNTIMQEPVKAIVIACNTATSIAISDLRAHTDIPIIGMEPAVKPAVEMNRISGRRVLVLATPLTLKESKYHELVKRVDDMSIVDSLPLPELVPYCESLQFDERIMTDYFRTKLALYDWAEYGTIVLGCTHYPFYKTILARLLPSHIQIVDGSAGTVKRLNEILLKHSMLNDQGSTDITFKCSNDDTAYIAKMKQAYTFYRHNN
jgi:glutamate racemase